LLAGDELEWSPGCSAAFAGSARQAAPGGGTMDPDQLKKHFELVRDSDDPAAILGFTSALVAEHDEGALGYHYALLKERGVASMLHDAICRKFHKHGEAGERFLLREIRTEKDVHAKGTVLQILGGMRYSGGRHLDETAGIARHLLDSDEVFLRNRATIVLGWVGGTEDVDRLRTRLHEERDAETRGWAASTLMQLYLNNEDLASRRGELLGILKRALSSEEDDFVLSCILVAIQEIAGKKLGLSARSHKTPPRDRLERARKKVMSIRADVGARR
jgi:hypothetical protein